MHVCYSMMLFSLLNVVTIFAAAQHEHEEPNNYVYAFSISVWNKNDQKMLFHNESSPAAHAQYSKAFADVCEHVGQCVAQCQKGAELTIIADGMRWMANDPAKKWIAYGAPGSENGCCEGLVYDISPGSPYSLKWHTIHNAIYTSFTQKPFIKMKPKHGEEEFERKRANAASSNSFVTVTDVSNTAMIPKKRWAEHRSSIQLLHTVPLPAPKSQAPKSPVPKSPLLAAIKRSPSTDSMSSTAAPAQGGVKITGAS